MFSTKAKKSTPKQPHPTSRVWALQTLAVPPRPTQPHPTPPHGMAFLHPPPGALTPRLKAVSR